MTQNERLKANARVDELNALALAENLGELRSELHQRFTALENRIAALESLAQKQATTIGVALQHKWGTGATVPDPNPEDRR